MGEVHVERQLNGKHESTNDVINVTPIVVDSRSVAPQEDCSPAGMQGRIKEAPVCVAEDLKKESVASGELAMMCFPPVIADELITAKEQSQSVPVSSSSSASSGGSAGPASGPTAKPDGIGKSEHRRQASAVANAKAVTRKTSRQGRTTQRWVLDPKTNQSIRLVTGCVPIMKDGRILFVTASRKREWILPKGGWEIDETMEESAIRETFEEAGVLGTLGPHLSEIEYETRKAKKRRLELEEMLKKQNKDQADLDTLGRSDPTHSPENESHEAEKADNGKMGTTQMNGNRVSPESLAEGASASNPSPMVSENGKKGQTAEPNHCTPSPEVIATIRAASDKHGASDETSSVTSDSSGTYSFVRMSLFPLYVTEVKDSWPESGRFRKVLEIDEAIEMMEGRPEFRAALMEVKEKGLHLVSGSSGNV